MDARRFAAEAGISVAEAERLLADAEAEKEYIDRLNNNEFINDMNDAMTQAPGKSDDSITKQLDEDKEIARKARDMADVAELLGWISIAISTVSIVLSVLRLLMK